jgi:hypothetical protein
MTLGQQQAARYRGTRIERHVEIAAPAAAVWALLDDVGGWSRWNPLYAEACGSIGLGDAIELAVVLPGMKPQKARATVLEMLPDRRLVYQTVAMGGLARGTRYIDIADTVDGCAVTNGEVMGGLVGPLLARAVGAKVEAALHGMNVALKARAEAG